MHFISELEDYRTIQFWMIIINLAQNWMSRTIQLAMDKYKFDPNYC